MRRIRTAEWRKLRWNPVLWIGIIAALCMGINLLFEPGNVHSEQQYWEACLKEAQTELSQWNIEQGSDAWNKLSKDDQTLILNNQKNKKRAEAALKAIQKGDWKAEVNWRYEQAKEQLEDYRNRPKSEQKDLFYYERTMEYYQSLMEKDLPPNNTNKISSAADAAARVPDRVSVIVGCILVCLGAVFVNRDKRKNAWNGFAAGGFSERSIVMAKWMVMIKTAFLLFAGEIILIIAIAAVSYGMGDWNSPQLAMDSILQFGGRTAIITIYEQAMWKLWIYLAYLVFMVSFGIVLSVLVPFPILSLGIAGIISVVTYLTEMSAAENLSDSFYTSFLFCYGNTEHITTGDIRYLTALCLLVGGTVVCLFLIWIGSAPIKKKEEDIVVQTIQWISIPFLKGKTPVVVHTERWEEASLEKLAKSWNPNKKGQVKEENDWMIIMPEPPFYLEMTMEQNLSYYGMIYGFSKEEIRSLIEEMKLSDFLKIRMKKCPASVYWKFWMLICHLKKPQLLVVDWPLIREENEELDFWQKWLRKETAVGREVIIASDGKDEWMKVCN